METADRRTQTTQYEVDKAETFMEKYAYYVFGYNNHKPTQGAAFVNEKGQVVGLMQQSARSLYAATACCPLQQQRWRWWQPQSSAYPHAHDTHHKAR